MNDIEVSSIDLVEGGNVFKQGHYLTLGYVPRDEKGETVDLSGKTLNVSLWGRKGVVFEAAATYSDGVIRFTLDKMVPAGDYTVEFTVTSSTDAKYRKKFPTNQHSGRIAIKQSADDLGVVGIQVYTVAQLKAEQKAIQTQYESTVDAKVQASDAKSTTALTKSTTAEATANDVKSQFEQVVISGDSSVEAAAARVAPDQTFVSLKARLDAKEQATALQLAGKAEQDEVDQLKIAKQIDFVSDLQAVSDFRTMNLQITASALYKFFSVNILSGDGKGIQYTFGKTYDDDYMMLMKGSTGDAVPVSAITRSANWESRDNETLTNPPNNYTTIVGDKLRFKFTGSKIGFISFRDNRGGLWKATLNAGTAGEQTKMISVFSTTTIAESEQILFENLTPQKHDLVMEFMGQDTANPVASPRGWYYTGGTLEQHVKRTFNVYNDTFTITPTSDIMFGSSFKEAIVEVRPLGSTEPAQYVPVHNAIGTAFNIVDTKILADGKPVVWNVGNYYHDVKVIQIIQRLHGFHPSDMVNPLFELTQYHTVKNGVVKISGKYKFLRDTEVTKASAMNITYYADVVDKIITSIGNSYDTISDGTYSAEYWEEADRAKSFVFISESETNVDRANTALAATIDNFDSTFRVGEENRGNPFSWIEHRSATMGKIYFRTMANGVKYVGDEMKFDGRYMVTLLPGVNHFVNP